MLTFRDLEANEIDCRIATVKSNGVSLLLYKDARVDQNILDETVGAFGWQRSHEVIDGNLYCTVSIYDKEHGIWVSKQDVGKESNTEKEKGKHPILSRERALTGESEGNCIQRLLFGFHQTNAKLQGISVMTNFMLNR